MTENGLNPVGERRAIVSDIVALMQSRFGADWIKDEEANLRFTIDAEQVLKEIDGVHLIGDPELTDGEVVLTCWVDDPIEDLMTADQIAYDIFGRISEQFFFVERQMQRRVIRYPFVTGSDRHGHTGALVLAGPHAADFADRHQLRIMGDVRFQA